MVEQIKNGAGNLLNTRFNKAVYATVVGAAVDFAFALLLELHIDVSASLQSKTLILAMALTTLFVPNKQKNGEEA